MEEIKALKNFTPFVVSLKKGSDPLVQWADLGKRRIVSPDVFADIIRRLKKEEPEAAMMETHPDLLEEVAASVPHVPPSCYVFMVGRCGSTLLANMCSQLERFIVLNEAVPVAGLLLGHYEGFSKADCARWLRGMLACLGQKRLGNEAAMLIKALPTEIKHFDIVQQAFPDLRWIFLYRDPAEVITSYLEKPSSTFKRTEPEIAEQLTFLKAQDIPNMTEVEFLARVYAGYCQAALDNYSPNCRLVNYTDLKQPDFLSRFLKFIQVDVTAEELAKMESARGLYSKDVKRQQAWDAKTAAPKEKVIAPHVAEAAQTFAGDVYQKLEALRKAQPL